MKELSLLARERRYSPETGLTGRQNRSGSNSISIIRDPIIKFVADATKFIGGHHLPSLLSQMPKLGRQIKCETVCCANDPKPIIIARSVSKPNR
jgi:hypothetical protein